MPTDTTQAIAAATSQTAKYVAAGAAVAGAFLAGVLLATSVGDYGVGLSNSGWDLARGGMILCSTIAVLAGMTWWGVEQVVRRLGDRLDRNRDAALALAYRLDQLEATLPKLMERARWEGYGGAVEDLNADRVVSLRSRG